MTAQSVAQRIAQCFPALSQSHREVARYVIDNPLKVATLPVNELAEHVGVSIATTNRFARALGYEGYAQFRSALVLGFEAALAPVEKLRREPTRASTPAAVFDAILAEIGRNIEAMRRGLDEAACAKAAAAIRSAARVYVVGFGSSSWLAGLLNRNLDAHRQDVHLLSTLEGPAFAARVLRRLTRADVVVVLGTPRYFADTVRLASRARENGATVLALTDGPHSPLVAHASVALYARTDSRYLSASDASLAALIEALSSAVAHGSGGLVAAATQLTEAVLPWLEGEYADWPPRASGPEGPARAPAAEAIEPSHDLDRRP